MVGFPCIAQRFADGSLYCWEFEKDGEAINVAIRGPLILNDSRLILEAAVAGAGLAFLLAGIAADALARGDVVALMEDWCPPFPGFFLYYPSRRQMRPALRAFIDVFKTSDPMRSDERDPAP